MKAGLQYRSTNGDTKALKILHCEDLVIVLGVQERTQGLERLVALDNGFRKKSSELHSNVHPESSH